MFDHEDTRSKEIFIYLWTIILGWPKYQIKVYKNQEYHNLSLIQKSRGKLYQTCHWSLKSSDKNLLYFRYYHFGTISIKSNTKGRSVDYKTCNRRNRLLAFGNLTDLRKPRWPFTPVKKPWGKINKLKCHKKESFIYTRHYIFLISRFRFKN